MHKSLHLFSAAAVCMAAFSVHAQVSGGTGVTTDANALSETNAAGQNTGLPLAQLIAIVARKTGKKFLVDPRVHAGVTLIGQEPANVTFPDAAERASGGRWLQQHPDHRGHVR